MKAKSNPNRRAHTVVSVYVELINKARKRAKWSQNRREREKHRRSLNRLRARLFEVLEIYDVT